MLAKKETCFSTSDGMVLPSYNVDRLAELPLMGIDLAATKSKSVCLEDIMKAVLLVESRENGKA